MAEPGEGWFATPRMNGFALPPAAVDRLQKTAEARVADTRQRFFSDRGDAVRGGGGIKQGGPANEADPGSLFSMYALYQPWNMAGGARKPLDTVPFPFLRDVRRKSVVDGLIIDTRIAQMKRFARRVITSGQRTVGFKVVHENYEDPNFHEDDDIRRRCLETLRRVENVTREIHMGAGVKNLMAQAVEEELTIDRKAMVIYRDRRGRPMRYHLVDGATIRPRLQVLLPYAFKHGLLDKLDLAAEILSDKTGVDLMNSAWVQEIDGRIVAAWAADEMDVDVTNLQTRINQWGYGVSLLEKSLEATKAFVFAWNFNTELFKTNYPEAVLAILGDYDPQGLEDFKRQILGDVGVGGNWRLPVIPGGPGDQFKVEVQKLRDTPQEMLFGELLRMLVAIKCAAYRMHPSEINFSSDMGSQSTIFGSEDTEKEVANASEEGMHTMLENITDWLTRTIVKQNYDDLILVIDGLNRPDRNTLISNISAETAAYKTVDEARAEMNLPKLPDGLGSYINNPLYFQQVQMKMQEEMQKQQQDAYEQGDFGQPGPDQGGAPPGQADQGGEPQESGSPQEEPGQYQAMPGGPVEMPEADMTQEGASRKPGQMGAVAPRGAVLANPAAKGKQFPMQKSFGHMVLMTTDEYANWHKSLPHAKTQPRGRVVTVKGRKLVITELEN